MEKFKSFVVGLRVLEDHKSVPLSLARLMASFYDLLSLDNPFSVSFCRFYC